MACCCGMGDVVVTGEMLTAKYAVILPHLDERQRRLVLGAEARMLGHGRDPAGGQGGRGAGGDGVGGRQRAGGGGGAAGPGPAAGRGPQATRGDGPGAGAALLALVEPEERGDPMSPLRWTVKSTRTLADELTAQGHPVSAGTVGSLLHGRGVQPAGQRQDDRGTASTRTGTPSSATSTSRSRPTWRPGIR